MGVYLIHFDEPYEHARHYVGFVDDAIHSFEAALETRLTYHRSGRGSRLLAVVAGAGIDWVVARTWPGESRDFERRLKGHSATRICPQCSGDAAWARHRGSIERQVMAEIVTLPS